MQDLVTGKEQKVEKDDLRGQLRKEFSRLRELPYIAPGDLQPEWVDGIYAPENAWEAEVEEIDVRKIVAGSVLKDWGDVDKVDPEKLANIKKEMESYYRDGVTEASKMKGYPLVVRDYGGVYMVLDGQKRTMVAKEMGLQTIRARVQKFEPTRLVFGESAERSWRPVIEGRRSQGLWSGDQIETSLDDKGDQIKSVFSMNGYNGLWVFSKDMTEARQIYNRVGASGKADEVVKIVGSE